MPRDEQFAADDDGPVAGTRWERFTGAVSNFMLKPAVNEASGGNVPVASAATTVAEIEAVPTTRSG
jgi:hypothetical protein